MKELFNMPKVSFIVTSYNYAQYIEECVYSILAQTYQNIEVIIVDDHSRDRSVTVINKIITENNSDIKIKLIEHKRTKGQLASIIDGICAANGEFIACIDSDDKLCPEYTFKHIATHLMLPCALSVCEMMEIDEHTTLHAISSPNLPPKNTEDIINEIKLKFKEIETKAAVKVLDRKTNFFGGWWWAPTSCAMFRKSAIIPFLNFDRLENWRSSPDKLLFNFLHLTGGSVKIYEPLVMYRRHGKNAGIGSYITGDTRYNSDKVKKQYLKNQINLYRDTLNFFKKNKKELKKIYSSKYYNKMLWEIYKSVPKLIFYKLRH